MCGEHGEHGDGRCCSYWPFRNALHGGAGASDASAACIGADADAWGQASVTATPHALSRSRVRGAALHSRGPQDPRDLDPGTRLLI
jgi:hypothetical protein